jgi:hypothetical protein
MSAITEMAPAGRGGVQVGGVSQFGICCPAAGTAEGTSTTQNDERRRIRHIDPPLILERITENENSGPSHFC